MLFDYVSLADQYFDQPVKHNQITYDNIRKIATGQGYHYTTGCILD